MKNHLQILKQIFTLSMPLAMTQICYMGMQVVDTFMMGQLGATELATGALGGVIIYNVSVFFVGILSSAGTLMAQAHGGNDFIKLSRILSQGVWVAILFSFLAILVILSMPAVLARFDINLYLIQQTDVYLKALLWGIPAWMLFFLFRDFSSIVGKANTVMLISILAIPLNALLNYLLMYGVFGLPKLGIAGIGYATSIVRWLMLVAVVIYLYNYKNVKIKPHLNMVFCRNTIKNILQLGWPSGVMMSLEIGMFTLTTFFMSSFGVLTLAAHQIAIQWTNVVFTLPLGISQAANIMIGKAKGGRNGQLISQTAWLAIVLGILLAIAIAVLFIACPTQLGKFFLDFKLLADSDVKEHVITFLFLAAILQLLDTIQIILIGSLRGMSDTFMPMLFGTAAYWVFGISSGYFLAFKLGYGGIGLWYGLCIGIAVSALLLAMRLNQLCKKEALLDSTKLN